MNRKLIRPSLSEIQDQMATRMQRKKPTPPEQTNAEMKAHAPGIGMTWMLFFTASLTK